MRTHGHGNGLIDGVAVMSMMVLLIKLLSRPWCFVLLVFGALIYSGHNRNDPPTISDPREEASFVCTKAMHHYVPLDSVAVRDAQLTRAVVHGWPSSNLVTMCLVRDNKLERVDTLPNNHLTER